jgi:hypothetical protein
MSKPLAHPYPWRSLAVWMAALIASMMALNACLAVANPAGFADRFGLIGSEDNGLGFVHVYASRALFLALVTAVLLSLRQFRAMGWFAAVAVVMPVADAALVSAADGPGTTILRHVIIAIYLVITSWLLLRLADKQERGS